MLPLPFLSAAQRVGGRYTSHLNNGGVTYFLCPKHVKHTTNIDGFTFDMAYHTRNDSVILNFTLLSAEPVNVESFFLQNENADTRYEGSNLSTLYHEIKRKKYETRVTSMFPLPDIRQAFSDTGVLRFEMHLSNGKHCRAAYGRSQWEKERQAITRIFNLIDYQQ